MQALGAELTRQAEHQGLPAVSTIREPAVITLRLGQVLPETKNGFLNRIVNGLRNLTLPMGIGSPSIGYYRKTQALPIREETQHKIDLMGLNNL